MLIRTCWNGFPRRALLLSSLGLAAPLALAQATAQPARTPPYAPGAPGAPAKPPAPSSPFSHAGANSTNTQTQAQATPTEQLAEKDASILGKLARAKVEGGAKGKPLTDSLTAKLNELKKVAAAKAAAAQNAAAKNTAHPTNINPSATPNSNLAANANAAKKPAVEPLSNGLAEADYVTLGQSTADKLAQNMDGDALAEALKTQIKDMRTARQQERQAAQQQNQVPLNANNNNGYRNNNANGNEGGDNNENGNMVQRGRSGYRKKGK